jgi:hypothetical protein
VSAGWVAAQVRGRSLVSHCIGPAGAREVASAGSLDAALAILATTGYGERLHPGLDLAMSERAVFATVLWNLRVLAGWSPALGASRLHVLAGSFELVNLGGELASIEGHDAPVPYNLGSLASVPRHPQPSSAAELRSVLKRSPWGDPGPLDSGGLIVALQFSLIRRIIEGVPEASAWAESYGALLLARVIVAGVSLEVGSVTAAEVRAVLGSRVLVSKSLADLVTALPIDIASTLDGVTGTYDLWVGEARWWGRLWRAAEDGVRRGRAEPATVVAAVAAQAADAWRVRVALEIAARAGHGIEVLDAVA